MRAARYGSDNEIFGPLFGEALEGAAFKVNVTQVEATIADHVGGFGTWQVEITWVFNGFCQARIKDLLAFLRADGVEQQQSYQDQAARSIFQVGSPQCTAAAIILE